MNDKKLRLFALRDVQTGKPIPDVTFPGKPEAKRERDRLNKAIKYDRYTITPGPDHHRFRGR